MHNIFQFIILLISNKTLWQNFKNHGWTWNQLLQHSRECLDALNVIDWGVIDWDQSSLMEDWLYLGLMGYIDFCHWLQVIVFVDWTDWWWWRWYEEGYTAAGDLRSWDTDVHRPEKQQEVKSRHLKISECCILFSMMTLDV